MNQSAEESLMALLEAMLTLAAGTEARRQQPKPTVNPGGYPEEQFLDVTEEERDELSCNICYQMLKETMQCVNHHKFCHSCLVVWSTTGEYANRIKCPVCRTRGYYFRNDAIDEKVGNKRMKCHLESCTWTGLAKYMSSHRHTTYGEEDAPSDAENKLPSPGSSSIPRLEQVVPRAPPVSTARFVGTGLTTRGPTVETNPQNVSSPRVSLLPGRAASRASTNSLSSTSQETVIDIGRGRGRRVSNGNATTGVLASRRSIPPVRAVGTNRITFAHTRPTPNPHPNPNQVATGTSDSTANADASSNNANRASLTSTSDSTDGLANSIAASGFTPRPPSAPRTSSNSINPRRLPRIINPLPPNSNSNNRPLQSSQITDSPAMPASSNNNEVQTEPGANLGNIRNHLQDSRNRLNNLMSSFTTELDRNRQEMMQFQHERETQRREQLDEVRQLSQRLGQVAFELRRLLEHRRSMPSFSDSDSDED